MRSLHIYVSGFVQGVFFRHNAEKKAEEIGIRGYVRNLDDGRVEIMAEGEEENIETFVEWLRKGPRNANVKNLDIEEKKEEEFKNFKIIY